ncbi:hypothetical protein TW65_00619 [Stemphylium lycopersici]|nr:hypothetical protein TW65_00619 [Stemphylium lycopersici]
MSPSKASKASSQASSKASKSSLKGRPRESPQSSEGLQIAQPETYPEAVNRYSIHGDTKLPQHNVHPNADERTSFRPGPHSDQSEYGATVEVSPDMLKKFFAHRQRKFWFIVVFTLFIVGTLIGSSIGGALSAAEDESSSADAPEETPSSDPTPTSANNPSEYWETDTTYTARPFGAVQSINATCPSTLLVSSRLEDKTSDISGRYTYNCLDSTNILSDSNLMGLTAYTLEQCVDACSQYSAMGSANGTCKAAVINSDFRQRYETGNGANCWLKGGAEDASTAKKGYTAAVLREG